MATATECNEGIYIHQNKRTGNAYVGTSGQLDQRALVSLRQRGACLGALADVQTVKIPTCGWSQTQRLQLERLLIRTMASTTRSCNIRIPRR